MHEHKWEMVKGDRNPWGLDRSEGWICTDKSHKTDAVSAIVGCFCGEGLCVDCIPDGDPNEVA